MIRIAAIGWLIAGLLMGCGQPVVTEDLTSVDGNAGASASASMPVTDGETVDLATLEVDAVQQAYMQTWTFVGSDAGTWENVFTREPLPPGAIRSWFADAGGGVLAGRLDYVPDGSKSGLDRLTADGVVSEVLPSDPDLYSLLVGSGLVDGRAVAIMGELAVQGGPDPWRLVAYDVVSGTEVASTVAEIGLSRDLDIPAAAVSDGVIAYVTAPRSANQDEGVRTVRLFVEIDGQATEVWSSDSEFVTGITFAPGPDGERLYVATAPRSLFDGAAGHAVLRIFQGTSPVEEIPLSSWGVVDEDWLVLPTRLSSNGRYMMVAGEPVTTHTNELVSYKDAPPSPVWLFEPQADNWTVLDVTGAWSLRDGATS